MSKRSCLNCKHWRERQYPDWFTTKYKAGTCVYLSAAAELGKNVDVCVTVEEKTKERSDENPFLVPWVITKADFSCATFVEKPDE